MRQVEFGTTGFYPAFSGVERARLSEEMGFDVQGFSENHSRAQTASGRCATLLGRPAGSNWRADRSISAPAIPGWSLPASSHSAVERGPGHLWCGERRLSRGRGRVRPQRIDDMARDLRYLRTFLDGGEVEYPNGKKSHLEWAEDLKWDLVPIQMACSGPRAVALAARIANRICLGIGTNVEWVARTLAIIDEGLADSGRNRDDIRIGLWAPLAITADRATGRAEIRTRVSAFAHMQSGGDLSHQPEILRRVTSALRDSYDYAFHKPGAPAENPNSALCDEEFGEWMGIGGPVSYNIERLGQLVDMGVDFFMTALPMPEREVFAAEIMPAVRAARY